MSWIPNEDPLNARLNELFERSGKMTKQFESLHPKHWEKILQRRQPNIPRSTLLEKIGPEIGMKREEMIDLIKETLKAHPKAKRQKQRTSTIKIQSDGVTLIQGALTPKLTLEMLPRLEMNAALRDQLSDDEKQLVLGAVLNDLLISVDSYERFLRETKRQYQYPYNFTTAKSLISHSFMNGQFDQHPLLTGIKSLLSTDPTQCLPEKLAQYSFTRSLQKMRLRLDTDQDFRTNVNGLLLLLKQGIKFPWSDPITEFMSVESYLDAWNMEKDKYREEWYEIRRNGM